MLTEKKKKNKEKIPALGHFSLHNLFKTFFFKLFFIYLEFRTTFQNKKKKV